MRDRSLGSTIRLKFTTTDVNGAPVAPSSAFAASDFRIYKDGSATEKTTTNGITVTSPFDSVVGRHLIEIDTSNSTGDSGFWASGSAYFVELNTAKTVNSQSVSGLEIGSFSLELQTADVRKAGGTAITQSSGRLEVNTTHWAGTAVASAGFVGDITTLLNRLTSTRAGNLDLLDVATSVLQSQITALNNLSAKCNWFGSLLLEIPDSGTRAYVFELVVKDDEDKLVNLDASPTIALVNSSGTDRSSLITTTIANPSTGRYTLTISVGTSTTTEALKLTATGTVSGETRYAVLMTQVVDYDTATMINSIYTRIGAPAGASIAADIADLPTVAEFEARSIAAASYATASALSSLAARVPAALVDGRMDCSVGAMASAVLTAAAIASGAFNGKGDWRTALTLKGSLTETQVLNLIMAALAGQTSQPSGTTEKFKHLDGTDAFTTTLDSNGNRTNVAIA